MGLKYEVVNFNVGENDWLMQIVHTHENGYRGSFLYKAAIYAARNLGSRKALIELGKEKFKSIIRNAEKKKLIGQHMDKPMHSVFF